MNKQKVHPDTEVTLTESEAAAAPLTLMDLLNSRENRVNHQRELLKQYALPNNKVSGAMSSSIENCRNVVLVSITLNIPGPVKDSPQYRKALETGLHRLKTMLDSDSILREEFRPLVTGPEGYMVLGCSKPGQTSEDFSAEIKKAAIAAEEADALGRLFDIDVLAIDDAVLRRKSSNDTSAKDTSANGTTADDAFHLSLTDIRSISRSQLGASPRKCLLCGENAKACARSRAHSMDDLLKKINEILSDAGL